MKRTFVAISSAALLSAALASAPATGAGADADAAPIKRVSISMFKFQPARIVVTRGTRIVWTNADSDPHTIRSKAAGWSSPALDTGKSFSRVARKAGTFRYICTIHPFMHGTVIVK
jgi:plastocyanin